MLPLPTSRRWSFLPCLETLEDRAVPAAVAVQLDILVPPAFESVSIPAIRSDLVRVEFESRLELSGPEIAETGEVLPEPTNPSAGMTEGLLDSTRQATLAASSATTHPRMNTIISDVAAQVPLVGTIRDVVANTIPAADLPPVPVTTPVVPVRLSVETMTGSSPISPPISVQIDTDGGPISPSVELSLGPTLDPAPLLPPLESGVVLPPSVIGALETVSEPVQEVLDPVEDLGTSPGGPDVRINGELVLGHPIGETLRPDATPQPLQLVDLCWLEDRSHSGTSSANIVVRENSGVDVIAYSFAQTHSWGTGSNRLAHSGPDSESEEAELEEVVFDVWLTPWFRSSLPSLGSEESAGHSSTATSESRSTASVTQGANVGTIPPMIETGPSHIGEMLVEKVPLGSPIGLEEVIDRLNALRLDLEELLSAHGINPWLVYGLVAAGVAGYVAHRKLKKRRKLCRSTCPDSPLVRFAFHF